MIPFLNPMMMTSEDSTLLELIGATYAAGTELIPPSHKPGDLLVLCAGRSSNGRPGTPTGWTLVESATASNGLAYRNITAFSRVGDGGLGTIASANAIHMTCLAFRNAKGVGKTATRAGSYSITSTLTFNSLSPIQPGSWVVGAFHSNYLAADPMSMVRAEGNMVAHTNGPVADFPLRTVPISPSAIPSSLSIEILQA